MVKDFYCNSKRLADYLIKNGSKLIKTKFVNDRKKYIFEYDESIDENLKRWEVAKKRCLF